MKAVIHLHSVGCDVVEFALRFDAQHRVLVVTMGAVVSEASAAAAVSAVKSFFAIEDPVSGIADLSAVEKVAVSASFVKYLAVRPPAIPTPKRCIVVAPRDVTYGLSRMFQILRDGVNFEVVHSMKEACDLLGIDLSGELTPVPAGTVSAQRG